MLVSSVPPAEGPPDPNKVQPGPAVLNVFVIPGEPTMVA